jgi:hypothetical protein
MMFCCTGGGASAPSSETFLPTERARHEADRLFQNCGEMLSSISDGQFSSTYTYVGSSELV